MRCIEHEYTKTLIINLHNYEKIFCISDGCSCSDDQLW